MKRPTGLLMLLIAVDASAQSPPSITTQPMNVAILNGGSAQFSVSVAGSSPFIYQWQFNGTNIPGSSNVITTVAGNGSSVYSGDSVSATKASLYYPSGVAVDAAGNLYIGDNGNNRVRKVDTNGVITTFAGNGAPGYTGDGAAASNASLFNPIGVALTANGSLLIADSVNESVRMVDTNGNISTVAGSGVAGFFGDGGQATNARLNTPYGAAVDAAGNIFIADHDNNRVRKVAASGIITTVAGNGSLGYSGDHGFATNAAINNVAGVALDSLGNLYIADQYDNRVRRVDANGIITTVAGNGNPGHSGDGGAATNANLNNTFGVTVDSLGTLYVSDYLGYYVRSVNSAGIISTFAGNGVYGYSGDGGFATNCELARPTALALDPAGRYLYIADQFNNRVRRISLLNTASLTLNNVSPALAGNYDVVVTSPYGSVTSSVATLTVWTRPAIITQPQNQSVEPNAGVTFSVSASGTGPLGYQWYGATVQNSATAMPNLLNGFVVSATVTSGGQGYTTVPPVQITGGGGSGATGTAVVNNGSVTAVNINSPGSGYTSAPAIQFGLPSPSALPGQTSSNLTLPNVNPGNSGNYDLVVTNLYGVATSSVASLTVLAAPQIQTQPQSQFAPVGGNVSFGVTTLGVVPMGYQWYFDGAAILNQTNASLGLLNLGIGAAGNYQVVASNSYGTVTSILATLNVGYPLAITNQPTNQGAILGTTATFTVGVSGTGPFSYWWQLNGTNLPGGVGLINTVAGNGGTVYSGDGVLATNTSLYYPSGVAVDAAGNVYIGDHDNNRVRKVDANGVITTFAGNGTPGHSGDGGAATNASVFNPVGLALTANGSLLIADSGNQCIRMVDTNSIITTVAGIGGGFSGDGGPATNARLNTPYAVAVDAVGNIFIADHDNNCVRKVGTNGIITTVAGNRNGGYSGDGGYATNAAINNAAGVAVDGLGNLYIADQYNNRVRRVDTNGIITTVAGNGSAGHSGDGGAATNAALNNAFGVAVDAFGTLYVSDYLGYYVRSVNSAGIISTFAGNGIGAFSGDGGVATNGSVYRPTQLALDPAGRYLYIADQFNERVRRVSIVNAANLALPNVSPTMAGNYDVVVTSPYGSVTSSVVTLSVWTLPALTTQPQNQSVELGGTATFAAAASGTQPLGYQWYGSTVQNTATAVPVLINGFVVGATMTGGGQGYTSAPQVQITGGGGTGAAGTAVVHNGTVTAINLTSAGLGYTSSPAIIIASPPPAPLANQTNTSLVLASIGTGDSGTYEVVVTNAYGSATSSLVSLSVLLTPDITVQPQSQSCLIGGSVTMSVSALGAAPLGYQWYSLPAQNMAHATPVVFDGFVVGANITSGGTGYATAPQVLILNGGGSGAIATATVNNGMVTAIYIQNAGVGYAGTPIIQIAPPPFSAIAGQTTSTLALNPALAGAEGYYYVLVTNAYGAETSGVAFLSVGLPDLQASRKGSNSLQMSFIGSAGSTYILQTTTNLTPPANWQPVFTNQADPNGHWSFTDTNTVAYPALFYRVTVP